ncbi:MAG: DUF2628 domain-containing protein [Paracoccaceae bacterium]
METRLWTVHRKGKGTSADRLDFIGDGFSIFALALPPIWAIWNGAWLTLVAIFVLAGAAAAYHPLAASPMMYGIGFILALEGSEIRRWERRLFGWREVSVVEARTIEGAEELWLTGQPA